MSNTTKQWEQQCSKHLKGKTIADVRYMTQAEADNFGWYYRPLVIFFTDGTYLIPMQDDEGNDGGAMFTNIKGLETIPVMR